MSGQTGINTTIRDPWGKMHVDALVARNSDSIVLYCESDPGSHQVLTSLEVICWVRTNQRKSLSGFSYARSANDFAISFLSCVRSALKESGGVLRAVPLVDYTALYGAPNPAQAVTLIEDKPRAKATTKSKAQHVNPYKDLSRIVAVLSVDDCGEGAICPHCGAEGRYIYSFLCEDGTQRAAMRGCLGKFPQHPVFAPEMTRILDKERRYKNAGWTLPAWDEEIKAAILAYAAGDVTEAAAKSRVLRAKHQAAAYRARRGR